MILSSDDYDASTAERWRWITRALPDAELDGFVDTMAARLASFERESPRVGKRPWSTERRFHRTRTW